MTGVFYFYSIGFLAHSFFCKFYNFFLHVVDWEPRKFVAFLKTLAVSKGFSLKLSLLRAASWSLPETLVLVPSVLCPAIE